MEYTVWRQIRTEKKLRGNYRQLSVALAKKLGPDRIHQFAEAKLDLGSAAFGQIIQMTEEHIALKQ